MDRHNLSQGDLLSIISLKYARNEVLEPPWYGFFGIIFREHLSRVEDSGNVATVIFPQLPITVEVGDFDIDDDDVSSWDDDNDDSDGYDSPTPSRATTDVESFLFPTKGSRSEPIHSHPTTEKKSTDPELPKSARFSSEMSMADYQRFMSTRVPDFVRRRFYLDDDLKIIASRIDLVVELKKKFSKCGKTKRTLKHALADTDIQAREQAKHALAGDKRLKVVGFIAAVGNVWKYGEVHRSDLGEGFHNAGQDSTYIPGSSSGTPSTKGSPPDLRTPPATQNQGFQRSPAPSPDSPQVLDPTPKIFTDPTSPEQKAWLGAIHDRLNLLDMEMAALYT